MGFTLGREKGLRFSCLYKTFSQLRVYLKRATELGRVVYVEWIDVCKSSSLFFYNFRKPLRPDNMWQNLCISFLRGHCMNVSPKLHWQPKYIVDSELRGVCQGKREQHKRVRVNPREKKRNIPSSKL